MIQKEAHADANKCTDLLTSGQAQEYTQVCGLSVSVSLSFAYTRARARARSLSLSLTLSLSLSLEFFPER